MRKEHEAQYKSPEVNHVLYTNVKELIVVDKDGDMSFRRTGFPITATVALEDGILTIQMVNK